MSASDIMGCMNGRRIVWAVVTILVAAMGGCDGAKSIVVAPPAMWHEQTGARTDITREHGSGGADAPEPEVVHLQDAREHYYGKFVDVVWLDVRSRKAYNAGHVRGAINVPLAMLRNKLAKIPRNTEVVVYCQGTWKGGSYSAAAGAGRLLLTNGYDHEKIKVLEEGYGAWRHAGYPAFTLRQKLRAKRCGGC